MEMAVSWNYLPNTRRVIVSQRLRDGQTASGILEFRIISGEGMLVHVVAKPDEQRVAEDPSNV